MKVTQVPYRGAGPALVDLLAVRWISARSRPWSPARWLRSGKLKAYAIFGRSVSPALPELPTFGELGYKKLDIDFWHMLLAPAGTPRPIVDKLNAALRAALADAKVKKTLADGGMDISGRRGNARGRGRVAQERDQTLGRGDPRQPHRGAVGVLVSRRRNPPQRRKRWRITLR